MAAGVASAVARCCNVAVRSIFPATHRAGSALIDDIGPRQQFSQVRGTELGRVLCKRAEILCPDPAARARKSPHAGVGAEAVSLRRRKKIQEENDRTLALRPIDPIGVRKWGWLVLACRLKRSAGLSHQTCQQTRSNISH